MACLQKLGFKTAAMALRDDSVSIDDAGLMAEDKLAVVLGTEGDGLGKDSHGTWGGFPECSSSQCSGILAAGKQNIIWGYEDDKNSYKQTAITMNHDLQSIHNIHKIRGSVRRVHTDET